MHKIKSFLMAFSVFAASFSTQAAVLDLVNSGVFNGHTYELWGFTGDIAGVSRLDWNQAEAYANTLTINGSQGYLATITSASEDNFVWNLGAQDYFLGAERDPTVADHSQGWAWADGEPFTYTNWLPGEPNNWQDGVRTQIFPENYLMYWGDIINGQAVNRGWNDTNLDSSYMVAGNPNLLYTTKGFVVEFNAVATPVPAAIWLFSSALVFWAGAASRKKNNFPTC